MDNNISLFKDLLHCAHDLSFWSYDSDMELISSNCQNENLLNMIFLSSNYDEYISENFSKHKKPIFLNNELGLIWLVGLNKVNDTLQNAYVIGPAFTDDISIPTIKKELDRRNYSVILKQEMLQVLKDLPVISITNFMNYGVMLHFCIAGEKILKNELEFQFPNLPRNKIDDIKSVDKHGTWAAEQLMMQKIKEGDLNYQEALKKLGNYGNTGKMSHGDVMRQAKNAVIIFISNCTRAAISGGLMPEIAFTLSDRYIQNIESSTSLFEIKEINKLMLDDFIRRVNKCKNQTSISNSIQLCLDYIDLHIEENITAKELSKYVGYEDYYLTKKFKKELGITLSNYVYSKKIEKAKILLRDLNLSIQNIAEMLGFCSQSYFSKVFKTHTGVSPAEFRLNCP